MSDYNEIEIRIPHSIGENLKDKIYESWKHERVAFALASHANIQGKLLILIKEIYHLNDEEYMDSVNHGASWKGASILPIINIAIQKKLGIFVFHSHFHKGRVSLSTDDFESAKRILPSYQNLVPWRPHGSIVLGEEHAAGVILHPDKETFDILSRLRWLENNISDWDDQKLNQDPTDVNRIYHRQSIMIKNTGQNVLNKSKIAVVGLSGGGSHVVQQLAHLGIGEIISIDSDTVTTENRHRMIGLRKIDVFLKRKKTAVLKRLTKQINKNIKFTPVPFNVPTQTAINYLKRADIVVGCVDTLQARSDIHELCQRYLIPYVDIGLLITMDRENETVNAIGGNIFTMIPGRECMWCTGIISEKRLNDETGGRPRSYIRGGEEQAQVVSFNGLLASAAVNSVFQLLIGFTNHDKSYALIKYDGMKNTLEGWLTKRNDACLNCKSHLGAGDPVWIDT